MTEIVFLAHLSECELNAIKFIKINIINKNETLFSFSSIHQPVISRVLHVVHRFVHQFIHQRSSVHSSALCCTSREAPQTLTMALTNLATVEAW